MFLGVNTQINRDSMHQVGPGGLDPNEVLNSLPAELAEAFVDQDTPRLKSVLAALPSEEAQYHMQRCIDSGLWVANA
jgi:hypothetical protein